MGEFSLEIIVAVYRHFLEKISIVSNINKVVTPNKVSKINLSKSLDFSKSLHLLTKGVHSVKK